MSEHRKLKKDEIAALESRGCTAESWDGVTVADPFQPDRIRNVHFSGKVQVGTFKKTVESVGGMKKPAGLYNSAIHNCQLGNDVLVRNVANISNYDLADEVVVEDVSTMAVEGETSFGNGVEIEPWNEGGGREIKIFDKLSAQIAYLIAAYRHRGTMQKKLDKIVSDYVKALRSTRGRLDKGTRVSACGKIVNVAAGPFATIEGARSLKEGTVRGCAEDPAYIGHGVVAEDFIVLSGSRVDGSATISKTFVGQGVRIGKQFSAENSVFFANGEGYHGEACSIFAGPYTVTHHKSTLLIAGMFSFYNAGSGTNQSNHMYKLGPVHQGILERGTKTASFSYLLWPARVGPFSVVMDKHGGNFDASNLPFSYLTVEGGKSVITPAMNLFTVGTRRDSEKWPARDRRKDPEKLDLINFTLLSPYIMQRVLRGMEDLGVLLEKAKKEQVSVLYKGATIKRLMLQTGRKYYELAVKIFLGDVVINAIESAGSDETLGALVNELAGLDELPMKQWVDVAGMLAPLCLVERAIEGIESGVVSNVEALHTKLKSVHDSYEEKEWNWCKALFSRRYPKLSAEEARERLLAILEDWKSSRTKLNNMIVSDATKEFDQSTRLGFGLDGDETVRDKDFEAVRGTAADNKFIKGLKDEIEGLESVVSRLSDRLKKVRVKA